MFIKIPQNGYHYGPDSIAKIEEMYNAKYMGYWCTKNLRDGWNESPVDVFYVAEPDRSKGHTNYFGMFRRDGDTSYITDASSAFSAPITGILTKDGEVIVSRFRHDYIVKDGYMIDGGRDYLRCSADSLQTFVNVSVEDGEFVLEVQNNTLNFQQGKENKNE